jgi:hypothetical protein
MSHMALHTLVGTALTDRRFCHDLLNGRRHTLLTEFDLTDKERKAVLAIRAESIQAFAAQLNEWLKAQEGPASLPPTDGTVTYPPQWSPVGSAFRRGNLIPRPRAYSFGR